MGGGGFRVVLSRSRRGWGPPRAGGRNRALPRARKPADILLGIEADMDTIAAALIVGAIPRNEIDTAIIGEAFGADVAALVGGALRAGPIETLDTHRTAAAQGAKAQNAAPGLETLRKMLLAMADDGRAEVMRM